MTILPFGNKSSFSHTCLRKDTWSQLHMMFLGLVGHALIYRDDRPQRGFARGLWYQKWVGWGCASTSTGHRTHSSTEQEYWTLSSHHITSHESLNMFSLVYLLNNFLGAMSKMMDEVEDARTAWVKASKVSSNPNGLQGMLLSPKSSWSKPPAKTYHSQYCTVDLNRKCKGYGSLRVE